jgi:hypothetical protein
MHTKTIIPKHVEIAQYLIENAPYMGKPLFDFYMQQNKLHACNLLMTRILSNEDKYVIYGYKLKQLRKTIVTVMVYIMQGGIINDDGSITLAY